MCSTDQCNGLDWIGEYVYVSDIEKDALESWRRPIVVLKERKKVQRYINDKLDTLGVMFPYLPFHYSLFEQGGFKALVVTSANAPNEPMVIDNNLAYVYVL